MSTFLVIVLSMLILATLAAAAWAGYVWWKRYVLYTRERFAFASLSLFGGLTSFVIISLLSQMTPWDALLNLIAQLAGTSYTPPLWRTTDVIFSFLLVLFFGWAVIEIFKNWDGKKSEVQRQREQAQQPTTFSVLVVESGLQVRQWLHPNEPILKEYSGEKESQPTMLQGAKADLAWHRQARELWQLHRRSHVFDVDEDWHEDHRCWIGKHKKTGDTVILACWQEMPQEQQLKQLLDYVARVQPSTQSSKPEIIIALKQGEDDKQESFQEHHIYYVSEAALLDKLIDFSDYFQDIRYQVEQKHLLESPLTIQQTYTPSYYKLQKDGEVQKEKVESFIIDKWLAEPSLRQVALLGEYGQGKSTTSLMLSYHLIQRRESGEKVKIPILLELRGKSPRTLTPKELLATWAIQYEISSNALEQLLMAGRLLLIFEGFDEVDLSGDSESRLNHFRTLWKLAYPQAKILITGRPNFFLDDTELKAALGIQEHSSEHPYCQAVYLAPFNNAQIAESLRATEKSTRDEIVNLAEQDNKFSEMVARPSLLYIVSTLWHQKNQENLDSQSLSSLARQGHLNSAVVMDLFIQHSYRRQGAKAEKLEQQDFMALNNAERAYFMEGIAVYMTVNELPNQISTSQLYEVVRTLFKAIPDIVSKSVNVTANETRQPLKQRFQKIPEEDAIEHIQTDVRTCGLLVTDLSKENAFKFGHKSFLEFLTAKVFAQWLVKQELPEDKKLVTESLVNTLKLRKQHVFRQKESRYFMVELLSAHIQKQKSVDEVQMAKGLFNAIFETDTLRQKVIAFSSKAILPFTGWLVQHFEKKLIKTLYLFVFIFVGVGVFTFTHEVVIAFGLAFLIGHIVIEVNISKSALAETTGKSTFLKVTDTLLAFAEITNKNAFKNAFAVSGTLLAFIIAFVSAGRFVKELGFTYLFALSMAMLILVLGFILGFLFGLQSHFLLKKGRQTPDSLWMNFELWYYACSRILKLERNTIVKIIGKNAMVLFEESESSGSSSYVVNENNSS